MKEKILIAVIVILVAVLIWQQFFNKKEIVYEPLKNPAVIEALKKDSINNAQNNKLIEELSNEIKEANIANLELEKEIDAYKQSIAKLRSQKVIDEERIKTLDEKALEEDINKRLQK